jgi:hypothetical protein
MFLREKTSLVMHASTVMQAGIPIPTLRQAQDRFWVMATWWLMFYLSEVKDEQRMMAA